MKTYKIIEYDADWAVLECPRTDCGGMFEIDRKFYGGLVPGGTHNPHIDTRPCPYCFRVSLRPKKIPKSATKR